MSLSTRLLLTNPPPPHTHTHVIFLWSDNHIFPLQNIKPRYVFISIYQTNSRYKKWHHCTAHIICSVKTLKNKKITIVNGEIESLVHKHMWKSAPTWLHVLLFPAMHEHLPVIIVPTTQYPFIVKVWVYFCDRRTYT